MTAITVLLTIAAVFNVIVFNAIFIVIVAGHDDEPEFTYERVHTNANPQGYHRASPTTSRIAPVSHPAHIHSTLYTDWDH